jgi:hypothetical protein
VSAIETLSELNSIGSKNRKGFGLEVGKPASLRDASLILKKAWEQLSEESIKRCWLKADVLPPLLDAELSEITQSKITSQEQTEDQILDLCSRMSTVAIKPSNNKNTEEELKGLVDEFEKFVDLENNEEFIEDALVDEVNDDAWQNDVLSIKISQEQQQEVEPDEEEDEIVVERFSRDDFDQAMFCSTYLLNFLKEMDISMQTSTKVQIYQSLKQFKKEIELWKSRATTLQLTMQDILALQRQSESQFS